MNDRGTTYWICSAPRSGSTWLCDGLTLSGVAGRPGEHFNPTSPGADGRRDATGTLSDLLEDVRRRGSGANGVVGTKVLWSQFVPLLARMRGALERPGFVDAQVLDAFVPGLRFVWLRRADKLRQAISLSRAVESRVWWRCSGDRPAAALPRPESMAGERNLVDWMHRIDGFRAMLERDDEGWRRFFQSASLSPLVVDYEQLAHGHGQVVEEMLDWLGLPRAVPVAASSLVKQGDRLSEELVHLYLTAKRQFREPRAKDYAGLMWRDD